jgi:hypothetical protein
MKKILVHLLLLLGFYTVQAQKSGPAPVITQYLFFTGTIDKYPVTFHLYRINNKFSGCYYYNSTEQSIDLSGSIGKDNFLKLTHTTENGAEVLEGVFKDSAFSGTWSYKGKLLPFRITRKKDAGNLQFDYIWATGSKKQKPVHDSDPDEITYEAAAVWPTATSQHPATEIIKQIIRNEFDEKNSQEEIGKILIRQKNSILNPVSNEDESPYADFNTTVQIEYRNDRLLTLFASSYNYTAGAAHPNHSTSYSCIDLINKRKLDITDVLDTLAGQATLHTLLEKKFRAAFNVKKEEKLSDYLFQNTISPVNNFLLTTKGIGFHYNPYAIGAYALGDVYLYIPFKEIETYLKPEFKHLIAQ